MAKQNIVEKHTLSVEGVLDVKEDKIVIEVEDIGARNLGNMLKAFDGRLVKISVNQTERNFSRKCNRRRRRIRTGYPVLIIFRKEF